MCKCLYKLLFHPSVCGHKGTYVAGCPRGRAEDLSILSREALVTQVALVWPLLSMGTQVTYQNGSLWKALRAEVALKTPLACMNVDVFFQMVHFLKFFVTETAVVAVLVLRLGTILCCRLDRGLQRCIKKTKRITGVLLFTGEMKTDNDKIKLRLITRMILRLRGMRYGGLLINSGPLCFLIKRHV